MAIRKIHEVGDPCLAKVCRPVTEFNDRLHELLDDMAETLEEAGLSLIHILHLSCAGGADRQR